MARHLGRKLSKLPPEEAEKKYRRRADRLAMEWVTDDMMQDAPEVFRCPEFAVIRKHEGVRGFIQSFWKWNEMVLWLVSSISFPYIQLQRKLAEMSKPYIGEYIMDFGCGSGNFLSQMFRVNGKKVSRIFAVDIDWESLIKVPNTLRSAGYRGKVALIQGSSLSRLPIYDGKLDTIISSLGGLMYAGWWFNKGQLICEKKDALIECLKDMNRILKADGHLCFSAPVPYPNWSAVLRGSLIHMLKKGDLKGMVKILTHGFKAKNLSEFMHQIEGDGRAHYLSIEAWKSVLLTTGFEVIASSSGEVYAGQGNVIIARKVRDLATPRSEQ